MILLTEYEDTEELSKIAKESRLSEAEISQPCCTAIQVALVTLLQEYGIMPDAVVGHSSGEIAAAFTCGSISAAEAMAIAYYRGKVMAGSSSTAGGMAAIGLGSAEIEPFLQPGVAVGCENSPVSTTITGQRDVLELVVASVKREYPEIFARMLHVDRAYHSRKSQSMLYNSVFGGGPRPF